jgi:hypothetical protein
MMMDEASGIINGEVSPTSAALDTPSSNNIQPPPPPPPLVPQLQGMGIDSSATHTSTPSNKDQSNDHTGI